MALVAQGNISILIPDIPKHMNRDVVDAVKIVFYIFSFL